MVYSFHNQLQTTYLNGKVTGFSYSSSFGIWERLLFSLQKRSAATPSIAQESEARDRGLTMPAAKVKVSIKCTDWL